MFALALVLITPPYAVLALASAPLPRMARYRVISGWSRLVVWLLDRVCRIRWSVEGREHLPASPAVDAGLDTGLDVNGPGEGRYTEDGPDLGAEESPY